MSSDTATDLTNTAWIAVYSPGGVNNLRVYFLAANNKLQLRPCIVQTLSGGHATGNIYGVWAPGPGGVFGFTAGAVSMVGTHTANSASANGFAMTTPIGAWTLTLDSSAPKPPAWPS